ncbi:MAG: sulfite exporter TauE/SafE family protein [Acidiferrobacterales bacterium]|nr:sulfite exporter TauE/SafE family protein [Acidiferrobacterales bacterium]
MLAYLFVLGVGLVAGIVSGIIGTGASIMLIPVLVLAYGPKQAVPIMAVAGLMANVGKILAWWREVDWRACLAYSLTGVPAAALGARTLLVLPSRTVDLALGVFFILMIPIGRWLNAHNLRLTLWHLALAGAGIGFLTGIVVSTGPLSVPAFASYGLVKGAFLATEAAGSLAVFLSKAVTFRGLGALPLDAILKGLIVGSSLMAGTCIAKKVVLRLSPELFRRLLDGLLLCSGLTLLWAASR